LKLIRLKDFQFRRSRDKFLDPRGFLTLKYRDPITKQIVDTFTKKNTIVYDGREIFGQKIFNKDIVTGSNEKQLFIAYMSVGDGGADPSDPNLILAPDVNDTGLVNELVIDATDPQCADGGKKKVISNIEFLQDVTKNNRYLIAKATMIINANQFVNTNFNEVGLWFADSNNPATVTTFKLASRITIGTTSKNNITDLIFEWYYYF